MNINEIAPGMIVTFTGLILDYRNPTIDMINIHDIAVGLSREFRFANQTHDPYTVAQHSVLVSNHTHMINNQLEGLLHDATEAYMKDIPSPLKMYMKDYKEIEDNLMRVIARKFNINYPFKPVLKEVDMDLLRFEWNKLFVERDHAFCMPISVAKTEFLKRFDEIQIQREKAARTFRDS